MIWTLISKIPGVQRACLAWLCHDVMQAFERGNTTVVFFADQYGLRDFDAVQNALAKRNPNWEIGFITVNTGNGLMSVFFVAKTLQLLWDSVSLYKNTLTSRWLAFHVGIYMTFIRAEAVRRNVPLLTDEIYP